MRMRLLLVPLFLGGAAFVACEDDDDPILPATSFSADLSGDDEVPPVTSDGAGTATFDIDGTTIDFTLSTTGLTDVTAAHIHGPADPGENAGVIVLLFSAQAEGAWPGTKTASFDAGDLAAGQGVTTLDALIDLMRSGDVYVNVHTAAHQPGEIRGQVLPD